MYEKPWIKVLPLTVNDVVSCSDSGESEWKDENVDQGGWTSFNF